MDKVVHFEIPADNVERAQKFYNSVFNWKMNPVPEIKYTIVHTVDVDEKQMPREVGAINGGIAERGMVNSVVITIGVSDIEKAVEKIKKSGGKITVNKFEIGDMGFGAYFKDTEGNIIGLFQPAQR